MLIDFSVTNFRSFAERQTLSLVRSTGKELEDTNAFTVPVATKKPLQLLRTTAIYGPNAAGKTNFLDAILIMRVVVLLNTCILDRSPITPFRMAEAWRDKPSEFEIQLIAGGVRYIYGFSATNERVHDEWLVAYPKGRPQLWFERKWNNKTNKHEWEFGGNLRGLKQRRQKDTRSTELFLSTAARLNSEQLDKQLRPVYDWFRDRLFMIIHGKVIHWEMSHRDGIPLLQDLHIVATMKSSAHRRKQILNLLQSADIDIMDVHPGKAHDERPDVRIEYKARDRGKVHFGFEDESSGTQRLFGLVNYMIDTLESGGVFVMDELHTHLHPELVEFLIGLFHSNETNPNNAQLIFTTHETSVMGPDVFRRDQIWFCKRNRNKESVLYSLLDYKPRKGIENLAAAYRHGRYGAVPLIRESMLDELQIPRVADE